MQFDVVIVGAGFGGMYAIHKLRQQGLKVRCIEAADGVGGVWRDNTYPGAACDVPSPLYSYSFAPNHEWPNRYSEQPAILEYIDDLEDYPLAEARARRNRSRKRRDAPAIRRGSSRAPTRR